MLQGLEAPGKVPEPVEAEAPRHSTVPSPPRGDRGPRWPADLPVVQEVIDPECMALERLTHGAAER